MKKVYRSFIAVSAFVLVLINAQAQDTVKIAFTGMTPHVGQHLYFRVIDKSNSSEVGRTSVLITAPNFTLGVGGIQPGSSYDLDFWADLTKNGKYDFPGDHAWRITLDTIKGDTVVPFAHNVNFTDIGWVYQLSLAFSNMTPHLGENLYFRLTYTNSGKEIERRKLKEVSANFDVNFDNIMTDSSYTVDFFADHNKNGRYDTPGLTSDHAWRVTVESVKGDTTVPFSHNINFTDIKWVQRITLALTNMSPHLGENLYFALKYKSTGWEIERQKLTEVAPDFNVVFDSIMVDSSYLIDFFADHNHNGLYDTPGLTSDHAWRVTVDSVKGDTVVPFAHNINFTDILWKYKLTVNFTDMTPHLNQLFKLYLRNNLTGAFIDSTVMDPLTKVNFNVISYAIMPDSSYNVDFWADLSGNRTYDVPPADHAWRIELMDVRGDTVLNFAHNTDFTDIGLGSVISGIDDINAKGFSTYPNPAIDELIIKPKQNGRNITGIKIYSSTGRLVIDKGQIPEAPEVRVSVSSLKPGLYILSVTDGVNTRKLKFVKQ